MPRQRDGSPFFGRQFGWCARVLWSCAVLAVSVAILPAAVVLQPMAPEVESLTGLSEGRDALAKADYKTAIRVFAREAEAGQAGALFALGYMHERGLGVSTSPVVAETFYREAVKRGNVPSMYNLAALLLARASTREEGREWLERAAEAGSGRAALAMGQWLADQAPDESKAAQAEQWLRRAMGAPDVKDEGAFALAVFLDPGLKGEGPRAAEGATLLRQAAEDGHLPAIFALSDRYLRSEKEAARAVELLQAARAQGSQEAAFRLAVIHAEGRVVKPDIAAAAALYRQAAEGGHAMAANQLAVAYQEGAGLPADAAQAFQWFRKGAELGLPMAQFNTGVCLENGQGVERNDVEACQWYYRAATGGYAPAQNRLAIRYQDGRGVMRDMVAARAWLREAAQRGFEAAILNYAGLLVAGEGGPRDVPGAFDLYRRLASQGHPRAQEALGELLEAGARGEPEPAAALALYRLAADKLPSAKERVAILEKALPDDLKAKAAEFTKNPSSIFQ